MRDQLLHYSARLLWVWSCDVHVIVLRLQVALKRHFLELRECLLVAMVPVVESAEAVVMSEAAVQTLQQGGSLEDLFKTLHKCVQELCKGRRSASSPAEEEVGSKCISHYSDLQELISVAQYD